MTNNYAILDIASKRKEDFLFNMYKMAKNAIDKGSRDNWTIHPKRIEAAKAAIAEAQAAEGGAAARRPRAAAADAAARRSRSTTASCTIRRCAIRAASSCRRISRTS